MRRPQQQRDGVILQPRPDRPRPQPIAEAQINEIRNQEQFAAIIAELRRNIGGAFNQLNDLSNQGKSLKTIIKEYKQLLDKLERISKNSGQNRQPIDQDNKYVFEIFFPSGASGSVAPLISGSSGNFGVQPIDWFEEFFKNAEKEHLELEETINIQPEPPPFTLLPRLLINMPESPPFTLLPRLLINVPEPPPFTLLPRLLINVPEPPPFTLLPRLLIN